jgi:low affinity Fe/Cu permease
MAKRPKEKLEEFAIAVTRFVGSLESIVIHSILFIASFIAVWAGLVPLDRMLLVLTTLVSLEAIYLSIFIQMTINYQAVSLEEVEQDIDEIQEDIDEIQEDVDEIQEDFEELSEEEKADEQREESQQRTLVEIQKDLQKLIGDIGRLQK